MKVAVLGAAGGIGQALAYYLNYNYPLKVNYRFTILHQ